MDPNLDDQSRLMDLAPGVKPDELADTIDHDGYTGEEPEGEAQAPSLWDRVTSDPAAAARLDALLQAGRDSIARTGNVDGPTAVTGLRQRFNLGGA